MSIFDEGPQDQESVPPVDFAVSLPTAVKEGWEVRTWYGTYSASIVLRRGDDEVRAHINKLGAPTLRGQHDGEFRPADWCVERLGNKILQELRAQAERLRREWQESDMADPN